MTPEESRSLGKIEANIEMLVREVSEFKSTAMSEQGFPRCAKHAQAVQDVKTSVVWIKRILLSCMGIPVIGVLIAKIWSAP